MPYRAIVGPHSMYVVRNNKTSVYVELTDEDDVESVRRKGALLHESIKKIVAFEAWIDHRNRMKRFYRLYDVIKENFIGPYFCDHSPAILSLKPWGKCTKDDFMILPRGVVSRLTREQERSERTCKS